MAALGQVATSRPSTLGTLPAGMFGGHHGTVNSEALCRPTSQNAATGARRRPVDVRV